MAGSITEKSIINDYAEGPVVTNDPSRSSRLFVFFIGKWGGSHLSWRGNPQIRTLTWRLTVLSFWWEFQVVFFIGTINHKISQSEIAPVSEIALRLNQQSRAKHKSKLRRTNLTPNTRDSILFFAHSLEWDSQFDLFSYQFDWASSLILYHYFSYWNSKLRSLGSLFTSGLPCPPEGREVTRSQRKKNAFCLEFAT